MADDQPTTDQQATADSASVPPPGGQAPPSHQSPLSVGSDEDPFAERPEAFVGAAFVGGLALALIMRRFAR
jgi:hypothetical protein